MQNFIFGTVKECGGKDHHGMLKVLPSIESSQDSDALWAKVLLPYAGNDHGVYFLPEVGDEVVVGFIGEPPSPIVMGCLSSEKLNTPLAVPGNNTKAIQTKGGHKITFTEGDDGELEIRTGKGHTVTLSDKNGTIRLATKDDGNSFTLKEREGSIEIFADKNISIKAQQITLEGDTSVKGMNLKLEAGRNLQMKSAQTKITADQLNATSTATATIESHGMLTIKGSMIKIN